MSKRLQSLALITFAACLPHAAAPQTPEQQLAGSNHLVFRNQFDVPICSIYFESYLEGERVLVQLLEGPGGPDDHIKLAPGAEKTFDAGAHTFEITVEACNHVEIGSLRRVDVKGPMVLGIGGKVTDVPAGFTTVEIPILLTHGGRGGGSCSPAYANEVDPTKCCSGKIDTNDNGSHYFCKP